MLNHDTILKIKRLRQRGENISKIGSILGLSRPTIYKYLEHENKNPPGSIRRGSSLPTQRDLFLPSHSTSGLETSAEIASDDQEDLNPLQEYGEDQCETPIVPEGKIRAAKKLYQDELSRRKEPQGQWVDEMVEWTQTYGIPWRASISASQKFEILDQVKSVLKNRSPNEDEFSIKDLIRETVQVKLQSYRAEEERKRKIAAQREEAECKAKLAAAEAERKAALEAQETRRKAEELRRQREKGAEEQKKVEQEAKRKLENLLEIGLKRLDSYILENKEDLDTVDYFEKREARQYLREILIEEIEGSESREEIEELTDSCLDEFFFQGDEESDNRE